ncbi:MAG: asparagine synthase C-terminal domain-containing protein [Candidatus Odinarchaeia archaeon]
MDNLFALENIQIENIKPILEYLINSGYNFSHFWQKNKEFNSLDQLTNSNHVVSPIIGFQTNNKILHLLNRNYPNKNPFVIWGEFKNKKLEDNLTNIGEFTDYINKFINDNFGKWEFIIKKLYDFLNKFTILAIINGKIEIITDYMGFMSLYRLKKDNSLVYSNSKFKLWLLNGSYTDELTKIPYESNISIGFIKRYEKEKNYLETLEKTLFSIVSENMPKNSIIGVMFSGGLDSLILAKIIKEVNLKFKLNNKIILLSAGLKNSADLINAKKANEYLKLPMEIVFFDENNVEKNLDTIFDIIERFDTLNIGLAIPQFFAFKKASSMGIKTIFIGQGADEIFYGYHKYKEAFLRGENVDELSKIDLVSLSHRNLEREIKLSAYFEITLCYPYLDPYVILFSRSLPIEYKLKIINGKLINKFILRKLAEKMGITTELLTNKKAMQYGSGAIKTLKKLSTAFRKLYKTQYAITEFLKDRYTAFINNKLKK